MFGSATESVDGSAKSVCSALHVPYLTTSMLKVKDELSYVPDEAVPPISLGPTQRDMVQAIADFVGQMGWNKIALISHRATGDFNFLQIQARV